MSILSDEADTNPTLPRWLKARECLLKSAVSLRCITGYQHHPVLPIRWRWSRRQAWIT